MRFASEGHTLKSAGWRLMFSEPLAVAQIINSGDHSFYFGVVPPPSNLRIHKQEPEFFILQRCVKS
jgi:hypothetical protein